MVPQTLEPGIDGRGDWRWLGFFGEKFDLGEFERKVTMGGSEKRSDKYRGVREGANVKCFTKI